MTTSGGGKISLMEAAEAVGDIARSQRAHVDRLERDRTDPLPPDDQWIIRARKFETAYLILAVMALDEDGSRKHVAPLMASPEGKLLVAMLTPVKPKAPAEAAAA